MDIGIPAVSRFETQIDILRYARYASHAFTIKDLMHDVTDWKWNRLKMTIQELVDDGYLSSVGKGKIFKFEKTEKTIQLFGGAE